jgi:hypothetical protein
MSDDKQTVVIDLDDPDFQQPGEYDPNQDMGARIAPPELDEDGNVIEHLIKLSIGEKDGKKQPYGTESKKGNKYIALLVKAQVVAPGLPYDGSFVQFPFGMVTTTTFNGTNSMADLARLLGEPMKPKLPLYEVAANITSLLEGEPMLPGRLIWSGYCRKCEKDIPELTGEKRWPEKKDPETGEVLGHLSLTDCPHCASEVEARVSIKRLLPAK